MTQVQGKNVKKSQKNTDGYPRFSKSTNTLDFPPCMKKSRF